MKKATLQKITDSEVELDRLESLVDELMKQKPQEERIKAYMQNVGLEYCTDPITRLGAVLQAIETKSKSR